MQRTGTLRKRKRRNIAKVHGLSTISYDNAEDTFDGQGLFSGVSFVASSKMRPSTSIRMNASALRSIRSEISSGGGVSRKTDFHIRSHSNFVNHTGSQVVQIGDKVGGSDISGSISGASRPILPDKGSMNRLKTLIYFGWTSLLFPWKWNEELRQIEKWGSTLESIWKCLYSLILIQTLGLSIFQVYSLHHHVSEGQTVSNRITFMGICRVLWFLYSLVYSLNMNLYKDQIRHYINTLLKFNKDYAEKYLIHLDDFEQGGKLIMNLGIPSNLSQISASIVLFMAMPYQPWYLFSYIYPKPNWYWLIPGAIQEFIMIGQMLVSYLLVVWYVAAHCNTVEFWLRETHNHNDSDYTTDEIRQPRVSMETYKSLQVLCNLFNDCLAPIGIPMAKTTVFTALIPIGFVLIRSMNQLFIEEFPGILTYPIGVIACASIGFGILTMSAKIYDVSSGFIDSWSLTGSPNFRRLLMSLSCLKVKVGSMYFITVTTTITFFKVVFGLITDCIIAFP